MRPLAQQLDVGIDELLLRLDHLQNGTLIQTQLVAGQCAKICFHVGSQPLDIDRCGS
jgi:hypothetical protein